MLKVKEIRSDGQSIDKKINDFLTENKISREDLIDIKYITVGVPQTIKTSCLIIYDKQ